MFCYQCQETLGNKGCNFKRGMCGKSNEAAILMDLLIHTLKGIAVLIEKNNELDDMEIKRLGLFIAQSLFKTITNANFDENKIKDQIKTALELRGQLAVKVADKSGLPDAATWITNEAEFIDKAVNIGVLATENEDIRSLRELLVYGSKGISAYAEHAAVLGFEDIEIYRFLIKALASTTKDLSVDEMVGLVLEAGRTAVKTMALLDQANTSTYGHPEITKVNIGVGKNPGILISGHDLKDMEELLKQTQDTGIDVYTHSEMLPANYYPAFKKYKHFIGNYGSSWWHQNEDFQSFNGPVLMTTNCIIPVKDSYKERIFTTGMAGYPGVKHIPDRQNGESKDFSELITIARTCKPPVELEKGSIIGGFAHNQVTVLADKIVSAVKSGAIRRFIVMAGCDGRQKSRGYFTDVAEKLPEDTVILTAGCAKYRYNKLGLGEIGGIPRVLDAGQCNDSYSLAVIALKLKEIFELEDVNQLPLSFDIAWYEQKAVAVLLALLSLGFKGIRLGPTIPAFLSPNVIKVLIENFNIKPITEAEDDIRDMLAGK